MKRFPVGLTVASVIAFVILAGLGYWQLQRLTWKEDLLARVAALRTAPARPISEIVSLARRGQDVEYRRVSATCGPFAGPTRVAYRYALRDGQVGWRLLDICRLDTGDFDGVLLDRGLVTSFTGLMTPGAMTFPASRDVVGVLRKPGDTPSLGPAETTTASGARVFRVLDGVSLIGVAADNGLRRPAPYILAVESETPAPPGVVPAPLPEDIPNNHFVYALTWFALAGILAWFYGAMLLRRLSSR